MGINKLDHAWLMDGIPALSLEGLMDLYSPGGLGLLFDLIRIPNESMKIRDAIQGRDSPFKMSDLLFFYQGQGLIEMDTGYVYLTSRGRVFTDSQLLRPDDFIDKYLK
jgi:hypothetical protein